MIYKDRVILVYVDEQDDFLDKRTVEKPSGKIPCMENTLQNLNRWGYLVNMI